MSAYWENSYTDLGKIVAYVIVSCDGCSLLRDTEEPAVKEKKFTIPEFRKLLKKQGWESGRGRDFCPACKGE